MASFSASESLCGPHSFADQRIEWTRPTLHRSHPTARHV
ncbi:hypothetical protein D187_004991 [Cystobacter fuscus DSM 2262]|uniref:Uncharacterized protein n=1 Tax=Cystobacter fuscus (strain ATCC 25194 / DSM 2262 / NBRC 100088 / M29) TaxID=1242864 RepID=S9PMZ7_CYSF2|nr:hypothetical protein D187_004991 [Cystobacter fuscus DSM 2262]